MKNKSEVFYDLVEDFYTALELFEQQRSEYERAVLAIASREGVDRRDLRLPAREVARLLDFKDLVALRDRYLAPMRENTRRLFGGHDRDILDIIVSDIFHLVSILKEEEFRVSHYAVLYDKMKRTADRDYILDSVHHDFPILLNQTHDLFRTARQRLEDLLPSYARDAFVTRSLYLFGASYLGAIYRDVGGMPGFYKVMYRDGGAAEAYLTVARSFLDGGFKSEAIEALERARAHVDAADTRTAYRAIAGEIARLATALSIS